jgi:5-formyltetrahydrofolate cyclo-ligase
MLKRHTPADKEELRRTLRLRRMSLTPEERQRLSLSATACITAGSFWQHAKIVALYMPVRGELDTAPLLADAWKNAKSVLLPVCSAKEKGKMYFMPCSGMASLRSGPFGILAPQLTAEEEESLPAGQKAGETPQGGERSAPDIIILPGLAFDRKGTRLGMGNGYYDRLLALPPYNNCLRLGLAYQFQLLDSLPEEAWDAPVHAVCTEQGILWIDKPHSPPTD